MKYEILYHEQNSHICVLESRIPQTPGPRSMYYNQIQSYDASKEWSNHSKMKK